MLCTGRFHSPSERLSKAEAQPSPQRTIMSLLIARSQSHGMNMMPFDVILARTQWLLVCF